MQDQNKPDAGPLSRLPLNKFRPSLRQRRLAAMGTAAAVVVVGLGAFALLPPVRHIPTAGEPSCWRPPIPVRRVRPGCWKTAPLSASPIWWSG